MPRQKEKRLTLAFLGEYYWDLIKVDSWINNRTHGVQGASLLCAKLQEREQRIRNRIEYLAKKRNMDPDDLWNQILTGEAQRMYVGEEDSEE